MKNKIFFFIPLLLLGLLFLFANSCKKDNSNDALIPVLTTIKVTDITHNTATSGGNITSDGGASVTARGVCWSTKQNPLPADNKTTDGTGAGEFTSSLSGLSPETTYYVRAYATNSVGTEYGTVMTFETPAINFTDSRDGNVYKTVTIGNQVWMAENLRYLPSVTDLATGSETEPCYYVYGYDGTDVAEAKAKDNYTTYGVLYNWPAAMAGSASSESNPSGVQGVCPDGWHLPGDAECDELIDYLGGKEFAGGKLKETGTTHWNNPNTGATNETGFTALPGGTRHSNGMFLGNGNYGYWWCATEQTSSFAYNREIAYNNSSVNRRSSNKKVGRSVRCVRD